MSQMPTMNVLFFLIGAYDICACNLFSYIGHILSIQANNTDETLVKWGQATLGCVPPVTIPVRAITF